MGPNDEPALADILPSISAFKPRRIPGRGGLTRAAVAAIIREQDSGVEILLVQRAKRAGDPWSGDMAFPGGRRQPEDGNTLETAIRETREETGLVLGSADCLGRLSDVITRKHEHWRPMVVTPYLFALPGEQNWELNRELVSRIWVPLAFLIDQGNRQRMRWKLGPVNVNAPCCFYEGYRIWGLTLMMIDGLLKLTGDGKAGRKPWRLK